MPTRRRRVLSALLVTPLAFVAAACGPRVERPRIVVREVLWRQVDPHGITLHLILAAYNPNPFELPLRDLDATFTLEGSRYRATVSNFAVRLPPQREVPVTADLFVPWRGLADVARLAITRPHLDWHLDGTITVEHYLTIAVPIHQRGTVDRETLIGRGIGLLERLQHGRHRPGGQD